ncbi:MAG: hypothetical protein IPO21_08455 [Bacteroidales bacterium]|nr:hypothetical protein [Bacteroidales bacterium]
MINLKYFLLTILAVFFFSLHLAAQESESGGEKDKIEEPPKLRQAKGVGKSGGKEEMYSSAKEKKRKQKLDRRNIRKSQKYKKRDYKKLRKRQQNPKTTRRMRKNDKKSKKINKK